METKKYIGVDLGAWYGNKTRIAVLEEKNNEELILIKLEKEPTKQSQPPKERDKSLVNCLLKESENNSIIAIDAPFNIPYYLCNKENENDIYLPQALANQRELKNPVLYDNSARFVFERTGQKVLAPAGDKIGKMTARMIKIIDEFNSRNNKNIKIIKTPELEIKNNEISVIEVYPTATLYKIIKSKNKNLWEKYLENSNNNKLKSYKNDNWNEQNKNRMLDLLSSCKISNIDDFKKKIEKDDDYDAIICALTAYLIDKHGFETPGEKEKFSNSFIFIPAIGQKKV